MDSYNVKMLERVAEEYSLEPALLKAVKEVETGGRSGFNPDGSPQILFEGHVFYRLLERKFGKRRTQTWAECCPSIVYPTWTKKQYIGGSKEHLRLQAAVKIDRECALMSASWGMFQIMGENYLLCGCKSIQEFINMVYSGPEAHLRLACNFMANRIYKGKPLMYWLKQKKFDIFAAGYNGPSYKSNQYDTKLKAAYEKNR